MPNPVVTGAVTMCTMGTAPGSLTGLSAPTVQIEGMPAATISDCQPMANLAPFLLCMSPANPATASLTAAALGVLTPGPCVPVTTPWLPQAPTVLVSGQPALTMGSTCQCAYGGTVSVSVPGSLRTMIG